VVVGGTKDGEQHRYICTLTSEGAGAGEGTGIPAALGAVLHLRGRLDAPPGVHPPEAVVPVDELLSLTGEVVGNMRIGGGAGVPLTVEHVAPDGSREVIPMAL
jgi:saccharopine dehydrogenase-like NADP-dependent oxidoreductase